jgi:UDP-N-acetylmuramyl tripeptide synthase
MEVREKLWLLGPGRRSDRTVLEQQIIFEPAELQALQDRGQQLLPRLQQKLQSWQAPQLPAMVTCEWNPGNVQQSFCEIFAGLAISLQRAARHRVYDHGVATDPQGQGCWVWFEYEHDAVAAAAEALALNLLAELEPALKVPELPGQAKALDDQSLAAFLAMAEPLVLPADTEAFIRAAEAADIPCVRLDRSPYEGVKGTFRVRANSLLKLGHGVHSLVLDGSLCVSRSAGLMTLLRDRKARRQHLASLQLPLASMDTQAGNCALSKHALRSAERIGYPVVLNATAVSGQLFSWPDIASAEELKNTLDVARRYASHIELEASVPGAVWQMLMVGQTPIALLSHGQPQALTSLHADTGKMAVRVAESLQSDVLLLSFKTTDIGQCLRASSGAWLDFDLAPRLDELLPSSPDVLMEVAAAFIQSLFPENAVARIPIVTVTGTNGKTTTCRMIEAIARQSGLGTGMACTGANYVNGQLVPWNERMGTGRQFRLLDKPEVQIAVLEEFLGTILGTGFAYQNSDVAVCTNVTEDHLGRLGISGVDDLVAVKALAMQRAREAIVLNADNEGSLAMMTHSGALNLGLVSMSLCAAELKAMLDRPGVICVLEEQQGQSWLTIYKGDQRTELLPVSDIPASFNGRAAHNTCNAMQSALAGYFLGFELEQIRTALKVFQMDFANSPGRLNMMEGLPFQFIMDYAHNLDGFRVLSAFVDQVPVDGRKILCLAFAGDRRNSEIQRAISYLAGHFDYFICRRYMGLRGREPEEIPRLIAGYLKDAGIPDSAIQLEFDPAEAIDNALNTALAGDLLIVLSGSSELERIWQKADAFKAQLLSGG